MKAEWKVFIKSSGKLLTSRLATMTLGGLELIIIVRNLGIENYGVFALTVAYATTVNQFFDLRVWETVVRYLTTFIVRRDYGKGIALLKLCGFIDILTGFVAFSVVIISAPFAAQYLSDDPRMVNFISLYAIYLLISTADGTTTGTLRVLNRFQEMAVLRLVRKTLQVTLIAIFLWNRLGISGVLLAYIVSGGVDAIAKVLLAMRYFPERLWPAIIHTPIIHIRPYFREILRLMVQTNIHATLKMLNSGAEILLLGFLSTPLQVGYYKLARQLIDLISRVSEPFYEVVYPQLAKLWEGGRVDEFKKLIFHVTAIMTAVLLPTLGVLIIFEEALIILVTGEKVAQVSPLIKLMAIGLAINFIFLWLHPSALIAGKAQWTNIARTFQGLLWVAGSLLLVPIYGAMGTASLYFVNHLVWLLIMMIWVAYPILWADTSVREIAHE